MSSEATLTSLAMLKINIDDGKDYLDYLKPFVLQILSEKELYNITDDIISKKIYELHGLKIPSRTVQIVLKRLVKDGIIYKENKLFYINRKIDIESWDDKKADATRKIRFITKSLIEFSKENNNRDITEDEAMELFTVFLSEFSIPCLKTFLRGTTLPDIQDKKTGK